MAFFEINSRKNISDLKQKNKDKCSRKNSEEIPLRKTSKEKFKEENLWKKI